MYKKPTMNRKKAIKPQTSIVKTVLDEPKQVELNEEWNNFMKRVGEVTTLVKDMSSGDKDRADAASKLADQFLQGKVIIDEDVTLTVKANRTVINQEAFKSLGKPDSDTVDKDVWMAEVGRDADRRAQDRKIRKEKAGTLKNIATKAFRREEYSRALSYYNKAIDQVKDNHMLYCDRALTNIKLGNFDKVYQDCEWAIRLNENSYKARLYAARAAKELDNQEELIKYTKELEEMFLEHKDLTNFFLNPKVLTKEAKEDDDKEVITTTIEV